MIKYKFIKHVLIMKQDIATLSTEDFDYRYNVQFFDSNKSHLSNENFIMDIWKWLAKWVERMLKGILEFFGIKKKKSDDIDEDLTKLNHKLKVIDDIFHDAGINAKILPFKISANVGNQLLKYHLAAPNPAYKGKGVCYFVAYTKEFADNKKYLKELQSIFDIMSITDIETTVKKLETSDFLSAKNISVVEDGEINGKKCYKIDIVKRDSTGYEVDGEADIDYYIACGEYTKLSEHLEELTDLRRKAFTKLTESYEKLAEAIEKKTFPNPEMGPALLKTFAPAAMFKLLELVDNATGALLSVRLSRNSVTTGLADAAGKDVAEKWDNYLKQKINSKDFEEFVKLGEDDDDYY